MRTTSHAHSVRGRWPARTGGARVTAYGLAAALAVLVLWAPAALARVSSPFVFGPPSTLSAAGSWSFIPQVAVSRNGDAVAVWNRIMGDPSRGFYAVEAATRPAGGRWSAPVRLTPADEYSYGPQVAISDKGEATIVWQRRVNDHQVIEATTRRAGGAWTAPAVLSAGGSHTPQVAVNGKGAAAVVWLRGIGEERFVESVTRAPRGGWSSPTVVSGTDAAPGEPRVAISDKADVTVVWFRWTSTGTVFESAMRPAGRPWSGVATMGRSDHLVASGPRVAVSAKGEAVAVWVRFTAVGHAIEAASARPGGPWSSPVTVRAVLAPSFLGVPEIAITPKGEATAVWTHATRSGGSVEAATRPAGGTWSAHDVLGGGVRAQVAVDDKGDAAAVWFRVTDSGAGVYYTTRPAAGAWSPPAALDPGDDTSASPDVAIGAKGDAVAVWENSSVDAQVIRAAAIAP